MSSAECAAQLSDQFENWAASLAASPACSSLTTALPFVLFCFSGFWEVLLKLWAMVCSPSRPVCARRWCCCDPVEDWLPSLRSSSQSSLNARCDLQLFPRELGSVCKPRADSVQYSQGTAVWGSSMGRPAHTPGLFPTRTPDLVWGCGSVPVAHRAAVCLGVRWRPVG